MRGRCIPDEYVRTSFIHVWVNSREHIVHVQSNSCDSFIVVVIVVVVVVSSLSSSSSYSLATTAASSRINNQARCIDGKIIGIAGS
jgi:hypothetical protein